MQLYFYSFTTLTFTVPFHLFHYGLFITFPGSQASQDRIGRRGRGGSLGGQGRDQADETDNDAGKLLRYTYGMSN